MNAAEIRDRIAHALSKSDVSVEPSEVPVEHTDDLKHGDYATSAALSFAKQAGMSPRELAQKIVDALGQIPGIAKASIAGPGFINFILDAGHIYRMLDIGRSHGNKWGSGTMLHGKKVMFEYTDPNPFKEFHIGHLVPNTLGESVSRLFEFAGAEVKRANYQGDVGIHVAKSLFIQLEKGITDPTIEDLAVSYPEGSRRYDDDTEAKKAIDELNKKIYDKSDERVNELYQKGRDLSLAYFEDIYSILGTKFDYYFFESQTGPVGVKEVKAHPDIFVESEGAIVFKGEEYGLHTRVFINKLGLPTYEAKELGLARLKSEVYPFDLTLTVTANEQAEYFKVVMKAMELALPELRGKLAFKTSGLLRFSEGKMSSRLGNIITAKELIHELKQKASERAEKSRADDADLLSQQIAVGAIKYQILKQGFGKDIIFDKERALSMEGDSGPYLQYALARTSAILKKAKESDVVAKFDETQSAGELVRLVYRFYEINMRAADQLEPHIVANYLTAVASAFNRWYANEQILDGTSYASHKVAITDVVRLTLQNGLWLLGISAPEKM